MHCLYRQPILTINDIEMKDFVKMTLAAMCGLFIMGIIGIFLFFGMIGALATAGSTKPVLPREGVLDLNLGEFLLGEQSKEGTPDLASGSFESIPTIGIYDAVQALDIAAYDPAVKFLYLRADNVSGGIATLQELRAGLVNFRNNGKAVIAYTETPGNASYYLASAADKIYMSADLGGQNMLFGISGRLTYFKDLLDKLGINIQLIRHGKYKSAGEPYIRSTPSEENIRQNQEMINSVWENYSGAMAESRGITADMLNGLIDDLALNFPEDFKNNGLVDELFTHEELMDKLCDLAVVSKQEDLKFIKFSDYITAKVTPKPTKSDNEIAVIYADGEIIDGNGTENVAGDRFVKIIDKVRKNDKIKAVVLRVNSPGGSVVASSKIKTAIDLLQAEKPVVASFGNYAASGGYWISNGCDYIYADPGTLTGSIGVFSIIPDLSKTYKNLLHLNISSVNSNRHSDMLSLSRPLDKDEEAYMQASVENIYSSFVNLVSEGRGMTPEEVDEIAQGRVWTGADAIGIGLVDQLGTLEEAIDYAARISEIDGAYRISSYPKPLSAMEQLLSILGSAPGNEEILSGTPFSALEDVAKGLKDGKPSGIMARMPYDIDIR